MRRAGFALVGGMSSRMQRNKALLPLGGRTLAESIASRMESSCGTVALIGDPAIYGKLGYPVYPDVHPGRGPLAGLHAALKLNFAEWNLLVACDMPLITGSVFETLFLHAEMLPHPDRACIAPVDGAGSLQPLCAVYHATCLPVVENALAAGRLKMHDLLADLQTVPITGFDSDAFTNVNTTSDWARFEVALPQ